MIEILTSELKNADSLRVGDKILLSGTVYTSRDAAHKKIFELINSGSALPYQINGASVYYAGPTPAKNGMAIGACGPTTSSRMDKYAPRMLDMGLYSMIGKGPRSPEVTEAIKRNKALYLCAIGGAGALACERITSCKVVAFPELGCESVKELIFDKFPLYVGIDSCGNSIFDRR